MRRILAFLITSSMAAIGLAQAPDPTRPAGAVSGTAAGSAAGAAERGVQVVIVRSRGKKSAAVINGQYVEVGDKVDGRRVLKITESEVVLKGDSGREAVKITPAIEKTPTVKPKRRIPAHDRNMNNG